MKYGVKELSQLSGVTVRTLHFYDEVGLLKPAYHSANGYRVYEEKELLVLQQILFFRELGFELKQIKRILNRSDFDKCAALESHRRVLEKNAQRMRGLIRTIDKTLEHLKGKRRMKDKALFSGFDKAKQAEYEKQLIDRFGEKMRKGIAQSRRRVKDWTKADWDRSGQEWDAICRDLVAAMKRRRKADSSEVQQLVARHYEWLKRFWTPNQESYAGHGEFIVTSELRNAYDQYDPGLAEFIANGIQVFAKDRLG
jgi:DNA-binding transcriptional MerR regulator